jgi:hypothetical protein
MMAEAETIGVRDLPEYLTARPAESPDDDPEDLPLAEVERRYAARVLARRSGTRSGQQRYSASIAQLLRDSSMTNIGAMLTRKHAANELRFLDAVEN